MGTVLGDITLEPKNSTLKNVGITRLSYFLKQEPISALQYSSQFAYAVEKFLNNYKSNKLIITFAHSHSLEVIFKIVRFFTKIKIFKTLKYFTIAEFLSHHLTIF